MPRQRMRLRCVRADAVLLSGRGSRVSDVLSQAGPLAEWVMEAFAMVTAALAFGPPDSPAQIYRFE